MSAIFPGRYAAHTDESFVVFLIGFSINKPLAVHRWFPVFAAMPPMIRELATHPDKGMLGSRVYLSWPVVLVVQHWRSFEHLEIFARNADDTHLAAWTRFNKQIGKSDVVGIYHETYLVQAGQYEAVYVNMPRFGLAKAADHVPATGSRLTARRRLGGQNEPAVKTVE